MSPSNQSDSEIVERIRAILAEPYNADYMVHAIRQVLEPKPEPKPIEHDERGFPILPGVIPLPDDGTPYDPRD